MFPGAKRGLAVVGDRRSGRFVRVKALGQRGVAGEEEGCELPLWWRR